LKNSEKLENNERIQKNWKIMKEYRIMEYLWLTDSNKKNKKNKMWAEGGKQEIYLKWPKS